MIFLEEPVMFNSYATNCQDGMIHWPNFFELPSGKLTISTLTLMTFPLKTECIPLPALFDYDGDFTRPGVKPTKRFWYVLIPSTPENSPEQPHLPRHEEQIFAVQTQQALWITWISRI